MFAFSETLVRRRVVVNLVSDKALAGILWAKRGPLLVLRDVTLHAPDGPEGGVSMDGEVVIERPQVEFIQVLS